MDGIRLGFVEMNWNFLFQIINTAIMLMMIGAAIYAIVLFIKTTKRIIRVTDVYLHEKAGKKNPEEENDYG